MLTQKSVEREIKWFGVDLKHRYLIEVDCSLGQIKSAKLKDKEHTLLHQVYKLN